MTIFSKNQLLNTKLLFRVVAGVSLAVLLTGACPVVDADNLPLAEGSRTQYVITLAADASAPEKTAAAELAAYLKKITGAEFAIVTPEQAAGKPMIAVGPGAAGTKMGPDTGKLGAEEWIVRSSDNDLYLVGGQPRGTLYAAYHFLEDVLGVHWWNPWEEAVPSQPTLKLGALNLRGKPTFRYRDIYMLYGQDGGRFAARNRLNRDGDSAITSEYGGHVAYGPPYLVHTFFLYFPPKEYFAAHPEWFSFIDGKRVGEGAQFCLTNPELRQAFLTKLRSYIATSWAEAKTANLPPPLVFSVSQNDWGNPCQCEPCQTIAKTEGSEAGPLLDFVNFMADGIKDQYPNVFVDTLAYNHTQQAPKTLKCRDNVIIRLCDTQADMLKPITAPENKAFRDHLLTWAGMSRNLRIWDYAVTYGSPNIGMPLPTAHTYGPDYRFYAAHNVEGVFTEMEYPVLADLRDFKVWVMMKRLENANADYDRLTDTFMDGHYGPAGKAVKAYLRALEREARACKSTSTCWQPFLPTYLNLAFVTRAQKLFDDADQAVKTDAELSRRVRFARLSLDRATLIAYAKMMSEWLAEHSGPEGFPLDRKAVGARALATWCAQIDQRVPEAQRAQEKLVAENEIKRFDIAIPAVTAPRIPEAGGDPRKADWTKAASLGNKWYARASDRPSTRKFSGRIAHDGQYLYLELTDPCETAKLNASPTVFCYDDWEIFFANKHWAVSYRQYALGPTGLTVALSHDEVNKANCIPVDDKGGMQAVSDTKAPDKWVSYVTFPLDKVVPEGVKSGEKIYMNITRVTGPAITGKNSYEIDSWVSFCSVHDVDRLAEITLAP